jgi:PTS system nitrogen regulatory IIA component
MAMEEIMTIKEVSQYLKMNERTISKLATQGVLPATKIANQWRFMRSLINQWLEQQMVGLTSEQLQLLESEINAKPLEVTQFLTPDLIIPDSRAETKNELLKEMLDLASAKKRITNPALVFKALIKREALCSTSVGNEIALPHPRQPLNKSYVKPTVVMARSLEGVDFDGFDELPAKLIFLLCLSDDYTHLKVLARLNRMLKDAEFRELLKSAAGSMEIFGLIKKKDVELSQAQAN